jgi:predicted Zn-dependent peptidase
VGSVDEKMGTTGISHLFEHLMFKGTPKYGPKEFFQQLEAKGAEVNAFTTRDYTVYYENFVPTLLEKVIDMESDRMANLTLTDDVLNSERMVVFEERRLRTDNSPDGRIQEALWQEAYHVHPYQWPVIGYPQDLRDMTLDKIQAYFKSHYQPANAAVIIVGDFNKDQIFDLIKKYYGGIKAEPRPVRNIRAEPEQTEERRLILRDQVASERFSEAYHVTAADNDDSYALDVLANILFEGTTSRAYKKLVEEMDICTGVAGTAFTPTYPGIFTISASMKQGVPAAQAETALWDVISEVQSKGVTADEVKVAVKQLTVQMVDSVRTPYGLGQLIGIVTTIFGDPNRFAEDLAKYTKIKPSDVQRVANKYLTPNNRTVITMVPGEAPKDSDMDSEDDQ